MLWHKRSSGGLAVAGVGFAFKCLENSFRMSHDLRTLFPNISADCLGGNAQDTGTAAVLEQDPGHASLGPGQIQGLNSAGFLVRITSVRKCQLDEDNLCEKYHVDCCRYAGLIPDDSPDQVRIETRQRKVRPGEAEHTQIDIFRLKPESPPQPVPTLPL